MAYSKRGGNLPGIVAGADLSNAQHRFITIDATGRAVLAGVGNRIDGALENDPELDQAAAIMGPDSVAKIEASAAVALGDSVSTDASGQARTAVAGDYIAGACVEAASGAGELCSVYLTFPGIQA